MELTVKNQKDNFMKPEGLEESRRKHQNHTRVARSKYIAAA